MANNPIFSTFRTRDIGLQLLQPPPFTIYQGNGSFTVHIVNKYNTPITWSWSYNSIQDTLPDGYTPDYAQTDNTKITFNVSVNTRENITDSFYLTATAGKYNAAETVQVTGNIYQVQTSSFIDLRASTSGGDVIVSYITATTIDSEGNLFVVGVISNDTDPYNIDDYGRGNAYNFGTLCNLNYSGLTEVQLQSESTTAGFICAYDTHGYLIGYSTIAMTLPITQSLAITPDYQNLMTAVAVDNVNGYLYVSCSFQNNVNLFTIDNYPLYEKDYKNIEANISNGLLITAGLIKFIKLIGPASTTYGVSDYNAMHTDGDESYGMSLAVDKGGDVYFSGYFGTNTNGPVAYFQTTFYEFTPAFGRMKIAREMDTIGRGIFLFHYDSDGYLINIRNIDYALYYAGEVIFGNYLTLDENGNIYVTGVCDDSINYLNLYIGEQPFVPSFIGETSVYIPTNEGGSVPGAYMIKYLPDLTTVIEYTYFYPAHTNYYLTITNLRYDPFAKKNYILGLIYHDDIITYENIYVDSYSFDYINGGYYNWEIILPFPNTTFTTVLLKFDLNGNNEGYSFIDSPNYDDLGIIARSLNTDSSGNVYIAGNYMLNSFYNPIDPINIYSIAPTPETAVQPFPPYLNISNVNYVIKYNSSGLYQGASYTYQNPFYGAPFCLPYINCQTTLTCSSIDTLNNLYVYGNFGSNINTIYMVSPITTNTSNSARTVPLLDSENISSAINTNTFTIATEPKLIEYSPYCGAVSNITLSPQQNKDILSWMPGKNDASYQIAKNTFAYNEFPQIPFFVGAWGYAEAIAFSGNGKVALVGAPRYNFGSSGDGIVYGYTNINNSWEFTYNIPYNGALYGNTAHYGSAISLSYDGTRAIVGGSNADGGGGYANIVYLAPINDFENLLLPYVGSTPPYFGNAVAMSGDGTRVIIGGFNANTSGYINGVVSIYTYYSYSGIFNTWSYPHTLDPSEYGLSSEVFNPTINNYFGSSVGLNYDGSVAIIGAPGDQYATTGSVIIVPDLPPSDPFICYLTINTLQIPAYFNYTSPPFTNLGTSVALSYDGTRAIASALSYNNIAPSYAVIYDIRYVRYIDMSARYLPYDVQLPYNSNLLIPSTSNANINNLSIDSDINTVVFNGYQYNLQTSTPIYCPDNLFVPPYDPPLFGNAVAMSYDGLTAVISTPNYKGGDGSVGIYKYAQSNAQWNLYGQVYTSNVNTAGNFGKAVALSGDGTILLISEPNNDICYIYNLHSESGIGPYPPTAMTSNTTLFTSEAYGNGIYIASASSTSTGNAYNVFDTDPTTSWNSSGDSTYDSGGGVGAQTIYRYPWNPTSPYTVYGEWVQIQLPEAIVLVSYTIRAPSTMTDYSTMPTGCYLLGSTDGSTWDYMRGEELEWNSTITSQTFLVNSDGSSYTYFRLLVNYINPAGNFATIGKFILNASDLPYTIIHDTDCPLYSYGTYSFGTSLALNYDGSKALIGVPNAGENGKGEVVYINISHTPLQYTILTSPLMYYTSAYTPDNSYFGYALALSYDGYTALISAPNYKQGPANANYYGYVARYSYNPGTTQWTSPKIVPIDKTLKTLDNYFGISLAMNSNASKIIISTIKLDQINPYSSTGVTSVYTYSNHTWSSPTFINKTDMYTTNSSNYNFYGTSLGMSADGNTVISTGISFYLINKYSPDTNSWTNIARGEYNNVYIPEYGYLGPLANTGGGPIAVLSGNATTACVGLSSFDSYSGQIYLYDLTRISIRPITSTQGDIKTTALSADGSKILCGIPSMKTNTDFGIANIQPAIVNSDVPRATIPSPNVTTRLEPDPSFVYNSDNLPGFGNAHAISADGNTAVVGAFFYANTGYVAVYRKVNDVWTLNPADVFDPNDPLNVNIGSATANALPNYSYSGGTSFGFSVDISGDGSTIIIGDPRNAIIIMTGYAVIFKSTQNLDGSYSWSQGYELLDLDGSTTFTHEQLYGLTVALNYDGNVAVVSAPGWLDSSDHNTGFVTIYNWYSGTNNYIINNIIFGSDIISNYSSILGTFMGMPWFGFSISISVNGLTVAIGMPYINNSDFPYSNGYVYLWYGGLDCSESILIESPQNITYNPLELGYKVKLSADGYTLSVGAPGYNIYGNGTTYVYNLNSPDFINNTIYNTGHLINNSIPFQLTDGITTGGGYCTLSGDGNTIISADLYSYNQVVVYKYVQNIWTNIATIPRPPQYGYPEFFPRVSLSTNNDGSIVFIGADFLNNSGYIILCSFDNNQNYIIKPLDANGNEGSSINAAQQNISSIQSSWNINYIYDGSGIPVTALTNQNHTATGISSSYLWEEIPLIYNTYQMTYGKYYYSLTVSNIPTSLYYNHSGSYLFIGIADNTIPFQIYSSYAHIFGIADDTSFRTYDWPQLPYTNFVNTQLWTKLCNYQNSQLFNSGDTIDIAIDTTDEISGLYYIWYRINNNFWNFNTDADPSTKTGGLPIHYLGPPLYYLTAYVYDGVGLTINSVSKNSVPQGFQFIG
jgi:hypothetical protein